MPGFELLQDLFLNYTIRTVALGAGVLGIVSGSLGSFAMLRKQSLLGDAMSHAALPGIVLVFLLTRSKAPLVLMLGASVAAWIATLVMMNIVNNTRIKSDGALGLVLSVFFGLGLMLLTYVQRLPDSRQAGLDTYLFGQAAALLARDVIAMAVMGGVALLLLGLFWKEFKLLSFDPAFGSSLGFPVRLLDVLLTTLLVIAVVVGLQAVGVVLMSAMVVAPAAAARQWTDRLGWMVALSAFFGAAAGVTGALLSSMFTGLSTGPTIVLVISGMVLISFLVAPNRGLIWSWLRFLRSRRELKLEGVLQDLYALEQQHPGQGHPHSLAVLRAMRQGGGVQESLGALRERGLVREVPGEGWTLTPAGVEAAQANLENLDKNGGEQ